MDNKIRCDVCECNLTTKAHYIKHLKTKKHLSNANGKQTFYCGDCNRTFKRKYCYDRHMKLHDVVNIETSYDDDDTIKDKITKPVDTAINIIKNNKTSKYENDLELLKIMYELKDQLQQERHKVQVLALEKELLKQQVVSTKDTCKVLTKQNEFSNTIAKCAQNLANSAIHTTGKVVGALQYAKQHYPDAPNLEKLDNYDSLEKYDKLVEKLLFYTNKGKLSDYLGDFLVKFYKKNIPNEQSIWATDISRLSFIVKQILRNKSDWRYDKKGLHVSNTIITPLLEHIKELLKKYINDIHAKIIGGKIIKHTCSSTQNSNDCNDCSSDSDNDVNDELDNNTRMQLVTNQKLATKIITDINNKSLAKAIVRYISPHLSLFQNTI